MAISKRQQIRDALVEVLKGIKTADGYNNNLDPANIFIGEVDFSKHAAKSVILSVLTGTSRYTPLATQQYTSGSGRQTADGLLIAVAFYSKVSASVDNAQVHEDFAEGMIQDIINIVLANRHLAGFALNTYLIECGFNTVSNIVQGYITFSVKYDFTLGSF